MLPVPSSLNLTEIKEEFKDYHPDESYKITQMMKDFAKKDYLSRFVERIEKLTPGIESLFELDFDNNDMVYCKNSLHLFSFKLFRQRHSPLRPCETRCGDRKSLQSEREALFVQHQSRPLRVF